MKNIIKFAKSKFMKLLDFYKRFPDEKDCIEYLKNAKLKQGLLCKKCGNTTFYWKEDRLMFECKKCNSRLSLKSDTIFEDSNLPIQLWFQVIHFISSTKKTFSALEIQRQLEYSNYETIWNMLHKIRWAMGERDKKYKLDTFIEIDEGFFKVVDKKLTKELIEENQKRGRGSINHLKVLVLVESQSVEEVLEKNKHKPNRKCGHLKMVVMDNLKADTINEEISKNVIPETEVITDKYKGYAKLKDILKHTEINTTGMKEVHKTFPWVHSAIGNAKKIMLGFHHSIGKDYLQSYLDEFCYKFNRRYMPDLFDRVIIACMISKKI